MRKLGWVLVAAAVCAVLYLVLQPRVKYAKLLGELASIKQLALPVDPAFALQLTAAAMAGGKAQGLKPTFATVMVTHEGKTLKARPAYTEKEAPQGMMMTATPAAFLKSVAADPDVQGAAINPGVSGVFSAVLDKEMVGRLSASLEKRGLK